MSISIQSNAKQLFLKNFIGAVLLFIAAVVGQTPMLLGFCYGVAYQGKKYPETPTEMMSFFSQNATLVYILLPFVFVLIALYFVVKYLHKKNFLEYITLNKRINWSKLFFSFGVWGSFLVITTGVSYYLHASEFEVTFKPKAFLVLFVIGTLLIPLQTTAEEFVFRGYLMRGFEYLFPNKWLPLIICASLFGGMHFANPEVAALGNIVFVYYIGTGLFLGGISLLDEGLELAMGFHAANNLVGALLVTAEWSAFQTNSVLRDITKPEAFFDVLLPVFVVYPILMLIFAKKYRWKNWREKLS